MRGQVKKYKIKNSYVTRDNNGRFKQWIPVKKRKIIRVKKMEGGKK